MTKTLTSGDLAHFTGSETVYRHGLMRSLRYTEGVRHVAEAGEAYWLIDAIASHQIDPQVAGEAFQVWKLTVAGSQAHLVCEDGNDRRICEQRIEFTDFPLTEIKMYLVGRTIMLPGEY